MDNFSFGSIYWPVLAALLSSTFILEVVSFGFRYRQFKKQEKMYQEMERKIASGEMSPEAFAPLMSDFGSIRIPMEPPQGNYPPTASGGHGSYL